MWGKFIGVAALSIAASCAVLTVDVDVYKGPMANEPDVQAQQLTAMAVAARPVLIRLRDAIEEPLWSGESAKFKDEVESKPYVVDRDLLKSTQGRVVNGVLGLYLDKVDPAIAAFVGKGRDIFEECKRLREQMERFEQDEKLWKRVRRTEANKEAYDALSPLISPPQRANRSASDRKVAAAAKLVGSEVHGATRRFEVLSDAGRVLPRLAEITSDEELSRALADRISQISKAYLDGRAKLAQGLDLALSFQIAVALHRAELENSDEILASNAKLISLLIQPQQLAILVSDRLGSSGVLRSRERAQLGVLPQAPSPAQFWTHDIYDRAAAALEQLLTAEPIQAADALRRVHRAILSSRSPISIESHPNADFRFGLARALTLEDAERAEIVEAFKTFRSTIALLGDTGLDGGRLDDGLLTMIQRYLEARDREHAAGIKEPKESTGERKRLMDGLIHFAEKLRFLASHDAVLGQASGSSTSRATAMNTYVMALESIGNSILTLANEERHRELYERSDESQKTRETAIDSLEAVSTALAELKKSIDAETASGTGDAAKNPKPDDTTDDKESTVATTKTESAREKFAAQLAEAEKLVNSTASLTAYIRPPWAYLRNSTPISALQPGAAPVQNLLTDHAHSALLGNGDATDFERMASALDRQYWQNINRVRTAGMGNTSYLLVKDDIGNWYVKGYSADPKPVLEGLQSMALAAQSGAMGMDLFGRLDARAKAREATTPADPAATNAPAGTGTSNTPAAPTTSNTPAEPAAPSTLVGKQAKRFEKVYADEAKAASKEVRDAHAELATDLIAVWEKIPAWKDESAAPLSVQRTELTGKVTAALPALTAAPADGADSPTLSKHVLAVLGMSLEFHGKVLELLDEARLVDGAQLSKLEADLSKAATDLELSKLSVALAEAKLEAIKGVSGVLPGDLKSAEDEVTGRKRDLGTSTKAHEAARAAFDAEAKRVAAAKRLVADLRKAVRDVVGAGVKDRIDARRKSSESYATALDVLSQGASDSN